MELVQSQACWDLPYSAVTHSSWQWQCCYSPSCCRVLIISYTHSRTTVCSQRQHLNRHGSSANPSIALRKTSNIALTQSPSTQWAISVHIIATFLLWCFIPAPNQMLVVNLGLRRKAGQRNKHYAVSHAGFVTFGSQFEAGWDWFDGAISLVYGAVGLQARRSGTRGGRPSETCGALVPSLGLPRPASSKAAPAELSTW